jgi:hypothetical protein
VSSPAGVYGDGRFPCDREGFYSSGRLLDDGTFVLHCALPFELDLPPSQWPLLEQHSYDHLGRPRLDGPLVWWALRRSRP